MSSIPALFAFMASVFPLWLRHRQKASQKRIINKRRSKGNETPTTQKAPSICTEESQSVVDRSKKTVVDVLLHNISHTDLVVSVANCGSECDDNIIARPKFGCFHEVSSRVHDNISSVDINSLDVLRRPAYSRHTLPRQPIDRSQKNEQMLPVGFNLSGLDVTIGNTEQLRFRDHDKAMAATAVSCTLSAIYFPLLAVVIPKWLDQMKGEQDTEKKILFLISGQGTPRDEGARIQDNSTEITAKLMKLFVEKEYPTIEVVLIHSTVNLFRYDSNIFFVRNHLLPTVDRIRNDMAATMGSDWVNYLRLTISFADGSSARISAINEALRQYRPYYMHFWQLKTFWHESKVCMDDIEYHSYHEIETKAPINIDHATPMVKMVVKEMLEFKRKFEAMRQLPTEQHDMNSFWLRKTRKPVLAVLLTQKADGQHEPRLYCGTNMEVSMPTGSLCAERNVIGSALAADLTLRRQDIRIVAVLSVTLDPSNDSERPRLDTAEDAGLKLPSLSLLNSASSSPVRKKSTQSECGEDEMSDLCSCDGNVLHSSPVLMPDRVDVSPPSSPERRGLNERSWSQGSAGTPGRKRTVTVFDNIDSPQNKVSKGRMAHELTPRKQDGRSRERIRTMASLALTHSVPPKRRIEVAKSDMNPLKPCGACLEWLKKIAEVNPSFLVVTFTDANCNGVYVEEITL